MNEEPRVVEEPVVEETTPGAEKSIADELARLGKQVAEAVKAAWESEDRKKIQADVADGLQKFGQEVSGAFERAAESEQAKEMRVKAERVADDIAKSDVVGEVRRGIVSGLEVVNRELGRLLERLEAKQGAATGDTTAGDMVTGETPSSGMPAGVNVTEDPATGSIAPDRSETEL